MEVVRKIGTVVLNFQIKQSVTLHDALHGLWVGSGTGSATLEVKLVQQLEGIAHEPLFKVFLDMQKACDYLDRGCVCVCVIVCVYVCLCVGVCVCVRVGVCG